MASIRPTNCCYSVSSRCTKVIMDVSQSVFKFLVFYACLTSMLTASILSNATPDLTLWEGQNAKLPCQFEDEVATVKWKKGENWTTATTLATYEGGVRSGSDNGRISISDTFSLIISNVMISDEGTYHCQGVDTGGKATNVITAVSVGVSPQEPYPTLTILRPNSTSRANDTCHYTLAQGTVIQLLCEVANFRPSVDLQWHIDSIPVAGTPLKLSNNGDGTYDASTVVTTDMDIAKMRITCTVSGEAIQEGTRDTTAVICSSQSSSGSGPSNGKKTAIIVVIVILLTAVLAGVIFWLRGILKDTLIRSNYTKSVSADDDTPSRSRMENFCHICYVACCPCCTKPEPAAETRKKTSSQPQQEPERKPKAPSAALKARIQKNRKKQQTAGEAPSDKQPESEPMLEDKPSTSHFATYVDEAPKETAPKPSTSIDEETLRSNPVHSKRWDPSENKDDEETKF